MRMTVLESLDLGLDPGSYIVVYENNLKELRHTQESVSAPCMWVIP